MAPGPQWSHEESPGGACALGPAEAGPGLTGQCAGRPVKTWALCFSPTGPPGTSQILLQGVDLNTDPVDAVPLSDPASLKKFKKSLLQVLLNRVPFGSQLWKVIKMLDIWLLCLFAG